MEKLEGRGWIKIGVTCSRGRRSLWFRENPSSFELCAGRDGEDSYVQVDETNPQFRELLDVMTTAKFAART